MPVSSSVLSKHNSKMDACVPHATAKNFTAEGWGLYIDEVYVLQGPLCELETANAAITLSDASIDAQENTLAADSILKIRHVLYCTPLHKYPTA